VNKINILLAAALLMSVISANAADHSMDHNRFFRDCSAQLYGMARYNTSGICGERVSVEIHFDDPVFCRVFAKTKVILVDSSQVSLFGDSNAVTGCYWPSYLNSVNSIAHSYEY